MPDPAVTRSFADHVATHSVALQRYAYLVCRHPEDAQDIVQDVLAAAFPKWGRIMRGNPDAYLRRAIVNAHISGWRRRRRAMTAVHRADSPPVDEPGVVVDERDWARRLCSQLPTRQRAAVILRVYEDFSFAQIGEVLSCTEAYARTLVSRGLATLKAHLNSENEDMP